MIRSEIALYCMCLNLGMRVDVELPASDGLALQDHIKYILCDYL